jgi:hypothetical protein
VDEDAYSESVGGSSGIDISERDRDVARLADNFSGDSRSWSSESDNNITRHFPRDFDTFT